MLVSRRFADAGRPGRAGLGERPRRRARRRPAADPGLEPDVDSIWALIFTSGTSDAPKAVICSQRRLLVTGNRMGMIMDLGPDDVGYVCMPLFHSNAVQVGWAPSIVYGVRRSGSAARFSRVALARRRPPLRLDLLQLHRQAARVPPGARPSSPTTPTTRCASRSATKARPRSSTTFARRFGVEVIDAYGATEGGVAVEPRRRGARRARSARCGDDVKVVDDDGNEKPRARFDADGRLRQRRRVRRRDRQHRGRRSVRGLLQQRRGDRDARPRFGWYWSGDLGYLDADGYLYFAGRNADWIRVDGENFPAGPIEDALRTAPRRRARRGLRRARRPGRRPGDGRPRAARRRGLRPGGVRALARRAGRRSARSGGPATCACSRDPPTTGTNKIVKRTLVHQKFRADRVGGDERLRPRPRRRPTYRPFTAADEAALHAVVRALRARAVLGPVAHGPVVHRRGAGVRGARSARGSPRTSSCRRAFASLAEEIAWGRRVAGEARRRPLGRHPLAGRVRRARRVAGAGRDLQHGVRAVARAAAGQPGRHQPRRARRCSRTAPTSRSSAGCRAILDAERDLVPAVQRARRRLRPRVAADHAPSPVDGGWLLVGPEGVDVATRSSPRWGICLARTDPDAPKHKGISYLVVDMQAPGIEIRPLVQITGEAEFNEVFFDDVFVPDDHLVGALHNGWAVANTTLAHERGTAFPFKEQVVHEVYLDELWRSRPTRGALDDVEIADALAQSFVELRVLRLHNWRTLSRLARGHRARARVELREARVDRHDPAPLGARARRASAPPRRCGGAPTTTRPAASGSASGCGRRRRRSPAAPRRCSARSSASASSACRVGRSVGMAPDACRGAGHRARSRRARRAPTSSARSRSYCERARARSRNGSTSGGGARCSSRRCASTRTTIIDLLPAPQRDAARTSTTSAS